MSYDYKVASADVLNASDEVVYSGASFTAALNWAVAHASTTTYVPAGTYTLAADITPAEGVTIYGDGDTTIFSSSTVIYIKAYRISNVTFQLFKLVGDVCILIQLGEGDAKGNIVFEDITITSLSAAVVAGIRTYTSTDATLDGVTFTRCKITDTCSYGFLIDGNGPANNNLTKNVTFTNCEASRCGIIDRVNAWVVGFDLGEGTNIENMDVVDCIATGNWESGFHIEVASAATGVQFTDCISNDNGQRPEPDFGFGYFFKSSLAGAAGINFTDCVGSGNSRGLSPLIQGVLA